MDFFINFFKFFRKERPLKRKKIEKLIKSSDAFCILPFKHMLLQPSGEATICCMSDVKIRDDNNKVIEWPKVNFKEQLWEGSFYKKLRSNMIKGIKSEECKRCYEMEETGSKSYRNGQNQRFLNNTQGTGKQGEKLYGTTDTPRRADLEITSIDVTTGNNHGHPIDWDIRFSRLCNLKCRMCDSASSSQIYKETQDNPQLQPYLGHAIGEEDHKFNYGEKDATYVLGTLPHVDRLKILGGEPTLDPQVQEVLDEAIRIGRDDIYLDITTNLTNVTDYWLKSLSRFKDVQLQFSIDATGKTNEYIRTTSHWPQIEKNIRRYLNFEIESNTNWMLSFHQTVSIYNIFDFWKLHEWVESLRAEDKFNRIETEFGYHCYVLHSPAELDAKILPLEYRAEILNNFNQYRPNIKQTHEDTGIQSVITLLESNTRPEHADALFEYCKKRTKAVDKVRGHYIKKYIPHWPMP